MQGSHLQAMMSHADYRTTSVYVNLNEEDVAEAHNRFNAVRLKVPTYGAIESGHRNSTAESSSAGWNLSFLPPRPLYGEMAVTSICSAQSLFPFGM